MKSMFDQSAVDLLKCRLSTLESSATPKWGSFTAPRMICHVIDQMEVALSGNTYAGTLEKGPPMFIRHAIRTVLPWPKNAPTVKEMLVTKPENWDSEIARILELMNAFPAAKGNVDWPFHPFFGNLNGEQWAKLTWRHTDFHFKQFGC